MSQNAIVTSSAVQQIEVMRAQIALEREIIEFEKERFEMLFQTGLLPKHITKWQQFVAITSYGRKLDVDMWTALRHIPVVNGNPEPDGQLKLALIYRSGLLKAISITDDGQKATCTMTRTDGKAVTSTFTQEEANRITSTYTKDNKQVTTRLVDKDVWKNYPADMRQWRAIGRAAKRLFSDVINGLAQTAPDAHLIVSEAIERPWALPPAESPAPQTVTGIGGIVETGLGNSGSRRIENRQSTVSAPIDSSPSAPQSTGKPANPDDFSLKETADAFYRAMNKMYGASAFNVNQALGVAIIEKWTRGWDAGERAVNQWLAEQLDKSVFDQEIGDEEPPPTPEVVSQTTAQDLKDRLTLLDKPETDDKPADPPPPPWYIDKMNAMLDLLKKDGYITGETPAALEAAAKALLPSDKKWSDYAKGSDAADVIKAAWKAAQAPAQPKSAPKSKSAPKKLAGDALDEALSYLSSTVSLKRDMIEETLGRKIEDMTRAEFDAALTKALHMHHLPLLVSAAKYTEAQKGVKVIDLSNDLLTVRVFDGRTNLKKMIGEGGEEWAKRNELEGWKLDAPEQPYHIGTLKVWWKTTEAGFPQAEKVEVIEVDFD